MWLYENSVFWRMKPFQKESKSGILCLKGSRDTAINTLPGGPKAEHFQRQKNVWLSFGGGMHTIKQY